MPKVKLSGFATAECQVRTVDDLRDLVAWCEKHAVPGDSIVDTGSDRVFIEVLGKASSVPGVWIECGDHLVDDLKYDILLETHTHGRSDDE